MCCGGVALKMVLFQYIDCKQSKKNGWWLNSARTLSISLLGPILQRSLQLWTNLQTSQKVTKNALPKRTFGLNYRTVSSSICRITSIRWEISILRTLFFSAIKCKFCRSGPLVWPVESGALYHWDYQSLAHSRKIMTNKGGRERERERRMQ